MSEPLRPSFWEELRKRRVVRAVSVYAVAAWVVVQVADTFFPALLLPDWTVTVVAGLAVLGFPITVALAWIFDRTPEGLQRTADQDPGSGAAGAGGGGDAASRVAGVDGRFLSALTLGVVLGVVVVGGVLWLATIVRGAGDAGEGAVVAVLPFETVGDANPVFTEGIHGDVLTRLSGVPSLDVISRSSVMGYRDTVKPAAQVATELGVGWILRGEVQQVGSRVQVNARLVDARRNLQVWANAWGEELTAENLFQIQREITQQIVAALEDRLVPRDGPTRTPVTTEDLRAYTLNVEARLLMKDRTEPTLRQAAALFQQALERDPGYAPAWAGLADALIYLETFGYEVPAGAPAARDAAERALALDPGMAEAHFALANLAHANRNNDEAIRQARRAIEIQPSYSDAFNLLSWMHKQHGEPGLALEAGRRAVELDPLGAAPRSNLALAYLALGDPVQAEAEARRIRDDNPGFSTGPFILALALYHQGRFGEAAPLLDGLSVDWAVTAPDATLAVTEVALGDTAAARRRLARIDSAADPFSHAVVRAALGETEPALSTIAGIDDWEYWPTFAVRYFFPDVLGPLRRDPRYPEILQRVEASWR